MTLSIPRETDNRRGWHLDKSINLPFLLSLLIAGMAAIGYIINQENRYTKVETRQESQDTELKTLKNDIKTDLTRIENQNIRMETKLDRVIMEKR